MNQTYHPTQATHGVSPVQRRRTTMILLLATAVALSVLSPRASLAAGIRASSVATRLDSYLADLSAHNQFSGAVLVAHQGTILLSKGYGLANRAQKIPNTPRTQYPVGGVTSSLTYLADVLLRQQGKLDDRASICTYLPACPATWRPITVHMLLDGTSQVPDYDWGHPDTTPIQGLTALQSQPLDGRPGSTIDYTTGDLLVLALIAERAAGEPWAIVLQHTIFDPAGMTRSGRMSDALAASVAQDYVGSDPKREDIYNDIFLEYATAPDVYAYDSAFFGGKLVPRQTLQTMLTPRTAATPPDAKIADSRFGYYWRLGQALGQPVIYTYSRIHSFFTINLRFARAGVTIVVIGNDEQNDVEDIALHLAALVFGERIVTPPIATVAPAKAIVATIRGPLGMGAFASSPGALWFSSANDQGTQSAVTRVDTRTNRLAARITVSTSDAPNQVADVATGHGQVWVTDVLHKAVDRIDPATNRIVTSIPLGIAPFGLVLSGNNLWAATPPADHPEDTIVRIDLRTQKVAAVMRHVGQPWYEIAASPDALWYIATATHKVQRLDAATNKIVAAISAGPDPVALAVGAGAVWAWDSSSALLTRIDPKTNRVAATITFTGYPGRLEGGRNVAVGAGAVWAIAGNRTLLRIDPRTNMVTAALTFGRPIAHLGVSEGSVWVGCDCNSSFEIDRIDPRAMVGH